jgi:D-alanine-D-alanine ligase
MKVTLAYNLKKEDLGKPADYFSEYDNIATIRAIVSALESKGHCVSLLDVESQDLFSYFRNNPTDIVFNIAEGAGTQFRESETPAILDILGIPHTGSSALSLAIALDKAMAKKILLSEGLPTPKFQIFTRGDEELDPGLHFPLIVKPNREGSSKGIGNFSVVDTRAGLYQAIKEVIDKYRQEALVEEFIAGKELTVGIMQNGKITVLPILEIDFSSCQRSGEYFYSWRMKEYQGNHELGLTPTFYCPARLDKDTEERVKDASIKAHRAIGCSDLSRVDIRLSNSGTPYILEINPLPGLDPQVSNFTLMAKAAGFRYEDLIESILLSALERQEGCG